MTTVYSGPRAVLGTDTVRVTGTDGTAVTEGLMGAILTTVGTQASCAGDDTHTADFTATGAQVFSGGSGADVIILTGTLGAGRAITLPLVTDLVAAITNFQPGMSYMFRVVNASSANFAWTVTTNTGWTLTGTMTVAQNTFRDFVLTLSSATAGTLKSVGVGTYS